MVKWTDHAKAQIRHIYEYIEQDSPFYARRVSESLVKKQLGLMPYLVKDVRCQN